MINSVSNILVIIGNYIDLTKRKRNYFGLCPFHDDTRPSLSINMEKGWYRCHACGAKGGGITKFHMTRYSLTFKQTIKELEIPCHIKILK